MNPQNTDNKKGGNIAAALVVGAAVGAATTFLSNENNRKKVSKLVHSLRDEGGKKLSDVTDTIDKAKSKVEKTINTRFPQKMNRKSPNQEKK